jgi:LysR family transcriptional regulator for bpeEF and oprC
MSMDKIQSMRAFTRVVEAGTFTKAAESLNLPKGTVTKQIQQLEEDLRIKLLNRTTRRVTVTPDGAAYYERAIRLLGDLDDIEASMRNAQAAPSGRLRVDIGASVARLLVIPALHTFFERYPDIQLDLGVSDRPVDLISDNVDCVIRGGELLEQSLVARRIGNIQFITVASPQYLARSAKAGQQLTEPAHLDPSHADYQGHRLINFFSARTGRQFMAEFVRDGEHVEIAGRYQLSVNESNAVTEAALAGLGITQIGSFGADQHLQSGRLVRVLPEWSHPPVPVYVVYPPNRHLSAKVRAFVDWAAELFAQQPALQGR